MSAIQVLSELCIFVIIEFLHLVDFGDWRKDFPRLNTNANCMLVNKFYHNFNTVLKWQYLFMQRVNHRNLPSL